MERLSLLYPSNCQELVKVTSYASADTLADTVIVADMEKFIEESEVANDKSDRKGALSVAKLAAFLQDPSLLG